MKRLTENDLQKIKRISYKTKQKNNESIGVTYPQGTKYRQIIYQSEQCFDAMYDIRKRACRNMGFYRGNKQWGDPVEVNGVIMTEEAYILSQGKPALKQNLIRPPLRNIIGQYRNNPFKSVVNSSSKDDQTAAEMVTISLEKTYHMNRGKARDARALEVYLLSGAVIYDTSYSFDHERMKAIAKFRAVELERFFIDTNMEDVLGEDIKIIGEIVDIPKIDLVSTYAKNKAQEAELDRIYSGVRDTYNDRGKAFDETHLTNLSFLIPSSSSLCRVIKVCVQEGEWRLLAHDYADASYEAYDMKDKVLLDAENTARKAMAEENGIEIPLIEYEEKLIKTWRYYHLTTTGHCLWEADSPYVHNSHPYVFKFYPNIKGAVWGMVEDLIDQQKMINRAIITQDFMNSAGAKGVLLFPEECKPDDLTWEEIADEWTRYNGLIRMKAKAGEIVPKQIVANTLNAGNTEMIRMQMQLMQDIGGVHGAIQGKTPAAGTPAALYAQEGINSSMNVLDYLETFAEFIQERDFKIIKLIIQFDKERHYQDIGNKNTSKEAKYWDPATIRDIDFENTISKGNDTPTYRSIVDDMLWNLLNQKLITLEMFLEHSSLPFSDKLLASIKTMKEQMQQGIPQEGMAGMQQQLQSITQQIPGQAQVAQPAIQTNQI